MASHGALPNLIVIGAMKCGTSALHAYLAEHPEVVMAASKELNFFAGPACLDGAAAGWTWQRGNWHRGVGWYARQFADARVRGESSPAYTSPSFPEAAARMAEIVPGARLVYLVRDPLDRALSQYRHHRGEGHERRPPAEALLDPHSHYVARSRFHERLAPFLDRFPREQIFICAQEELLAEPRSTLRALYGSLGIDDGFWRGRRAAPSPPRADVPLPPDLRVRLAAEVGEDAARLRELAGRDFPGWTA